MGKDNTFLGLLATKPEGNSVLTPNLGNNRGKGASPASSPPLPPLQQRQQILQGGKLFLCCLGQIQTHCNNKHSFTLTTGSGLAPDLTMLRAQLGEEGTLLQLKTCPSRAVSDGWKH